MLDYLLAGNARFSSGAALHPRQTPARREAVAAAQQPLAAILTCADSRVPPEILFDQGLGDLYVTRVAGNMATDLVVGSLELALAALDVRLLVVLSHDLCAAVSTALWTFRPDIEQPLAPPAWQADSPAQGTRAPGAIDAVLSSIRPGIDGPAHAGLDSLSAAIDANLRHTVAQLKRSALVVAQPGRPAVAVVGARYATVTGKVSLIVS